MAATCNKPILVIHTSPWLMALSKLIKIHYKLAWGISSLEILPPTQHFSFLYTKDVIHDKIGQIPVATINQANLAKEIVYTNFFKY